jgi:hypothetical protein
MNHAGNQLGSPGEENKKIYVRPKISCHCLFNVGNILSVVLRKKNKFGNFFVSLK